MTSLKQEYEAIREKMDSILPSVVQTLEQLACKLEIPLALPVSSRVKSWESVEPKLKRLNHLNLKSITQIEDLIGLRVVFLFSSDVAKFGAALPRDFQVIKLGRQPTVTP